MERPLPAATVELRPGSNVRSALFTPRKAAGGLGRVGRCTLSVDGDHCIVAFRGSDPNGQRFIPLRARHVKLACPSAPEIDYFDDDWCEQRQLQDPPEIAARNPLGGCQLADEV